MWDRFFSKPCNNFGGKVVLYMKGDLYHEKNLINNFSAYHAFIPHCLRLTGERAGGYY